jgi:hypothetical protein
MKRWMKVSLCLVAGSVVLLIGEPTGTGINEPPGGGGCNGPLITQGPTDQTACLNNSASFTVSASGAQSYQWLKNGGTLSDGGTVSGAASSQLQLSSVTTDDSGSSYRVVVANDCGPAISSVATLTVITTAPSITQHPQSKTKCEGQSVTFSVTATGDSPSYQWQKNTDNISGATNATLAFSNVAMSDAGSYRVVVANACGTQTSNAATLTVLPDRDHDGLPDDIDADPDHPDTTPPSFTVIYPAAGATVP